MSRFLSSFDPSTYRKFLFRGISNFYQHGTSNNQTQHSLGSSTSLEPEKEKSTSSATHLSNAVLHHALHKDNPSFSPKKKNEDAFSKHVTMASNYYMLSEKHCRFVYSPAKSCHISKENILEVVEMLDETSTVEKFCERYDNMRSLKCELDGSISKSLLRLDQSEWCTSLSTYVRDIDNHFGLLANGHASEILSCTENKTKYEDLEKLEHLFTRMFDEMKEFAFRNSNRDIERTVSDMFSIQQSNLKYDSCDRNNAVDLLFTSSYANELSSRARSCDVAYSSVLNSDQVKFRTTLRAEDQDKRGDSKDNRPNRYQLEKVQNYFVDRLPNILDEPFDYSVYTDDVILINEWVDRPYAKRGLSSCQFELWKLKMWINIKFKSASVHVLNTVINENTSSVKIRWRITGQSKLNLFKKTSQSTDGPVSRKDLENEWHDGVSTLYVNGNGLVYKHVIDKMDKETHKPKIRNTLKGKVAAALGLAGAASFDEI